MHTHTSSQKDKTYQLLKILKGTEVSKTSVQNVKVAEQTFAIESAQKKQLRNVEL